MKSQKIRQYIANLESGFIKSKNLQVLQAIYRAYGTTIYQLRYDTSISHQTLTSAISNLMDEGIVYIVGRTEIENKHYSKFAVTTDMNHINRNVNNRKQEKILTWLKNGLEIGLPLSIVRELKSYKNSLNQPTQTNLFDL